MPRQVLNISEDDGRVKSNQIWNKSSSKMAGENDQQLAMATFCIPEITETLSKEACDEVRKSSDRFFTDIQASQLPNLRYVCDKAMIGSRCQIQVLPPLHNEGRFYGIVVMGPRGQVQSISDQLKSSALHQVCQVVDVPCVLEGFMEVIKEKIFDISQGSDCIILVHDAKDEMKQGSPVLNGQKNQTSRIIITGERSEVERQVLRTFVMFQDLLGCHVDYVEIEDARLLNIMAGPRRRTFETIMEQTGVSIFVPLPYENLQGNFIDAISPISKETNVCESIGKRSVASSSTLILTGEKSNVLEAKQQIQEIYRNVKDIILSKSATIMTKKLEWILNWKHEKICQALRNSGTFVRFKKIDDLYSSVTAYATSQISLDSILNEISKLAFELKVVDLWMDNSKFTASKETKLQELIEVSQKCCIELKVINNVISVHGPSKCILIFFQSLSPSLTAAMVEAKLQVENDAGIKDFVAGKKDGKINKIMKSTDTFIMIQNFLEKSILIELSGKSVSQVAEAYKQLEEEFPAEISFFVPEIHHKRIIGHGGKNIQKIMKKYGVYIKFLNAEEARLQFGDPFCNQKANQLCSLPNVLVKTPAKNSDALELMKVEVLEIANYSEAVKETIGLPVPKILQSWLWSQKFKSIRDLESLTQTSIYVPPAESNEIELRISGIMSKVELAKKILLEFVPQDFVWNFQANKEEFLEQIEEKQFKKYMENASVQNEISFLIPRYCNTNSLCIILRCSKKSIANISLAQSTICDYLKSKNITLSRGSLDQCYKLNAELKESPPSKSFNVPSLSNSPFSSNQAKFKHFNSFLLFPEEEKSQTIMEQKWKAEVQALSSMKHSSSAPTMQSFLDNMMGSKKSAGPKVDRWGQMNGDMPGSSGSLGLSLFDKIDFLKGKDPLFDRNGFHEHSAMNQRRDTDSRL